MVQKLERRERDLIKTPAFSSFDYILLVFPCFSFQIFLNSSRQLRRDKILSTRYFTECLSKHQSETVGKLMPTRKIFLVCVPP